MATSVNESCERGALVNKVAGPDLSKAQEVERMEMKFPGNAFPLLKERFIAGKIFTDPMDVIRLILEVRDIMLLPVKDIKDKGLGTIVLMGITGAGKSTFGNWFLGRELVKVVDDDDDVAEIQCEDPLLKMGGGRTSTTFAPNVALTSDGATALIDWPGFADTNGFEVRIGMDLAFRNMIDWMKPAHVITLIPIDSFTAGKGTLLRQQLSKTTRLLPTWNAPLSASIKATEADACKWVVGVTKCDKDFIKGAKKAYGEAVQVLEDLEPSLAGNVIDINKHMFAGDSAGPQQLRTFLLDETKTPTRPNDELKKVVDECFPSNTSLETLKTLVSWLSGPAPVTLVSDCLNATDAAGLQMSLSTHGFLNSFLSDGQGDQTTELASFAQGAMDWPAAKTAIKKSQEKMKATTQAIIRDSDNLVKHNLLSIERRIPEVHVLCSQRQCRLKLLFAEIEKDLLLSEMNFIQMAKQGYAKTVSDLNEHGLLRAQHLAELERKLKEVEESFEKDVKAMGYDNVLTFGRYAGGLLGSVGVIGSVSMLAHVAATSTSLGAFLAGTGSWSAVSAGATAGLLTGGILLGVGAVGLAIYGGFKLWTNYGDNESGEITEELKKGLEDIKNAHTACADHSTKLGAIVTKLKRLQVLEKD